MLPQRSHITRKRGIYYYRRRLPGRRRGEVAVSLRTRSYREAEHRADTLNEAFAPAWERAGLMETDETRLGAALREHLRQALDADLLRRMHRPEGAPVYGQAWRPGDAGTVTDADLAAIRSARASAARELASGTPDTALEAAANGLLMRFGLPAHLRPRLVQGMMEAALRAWDVAERRTLGTEPLTADAADPVGASGPPPAAPPPAPEPAPDAAPAKPLASSLVDPFFVRRETVDRATHQVMGQERGTLRRFIEACGDRPVNRYGRGDVTGFMDTLRKLPNTYGKSPKDKDRSLADLIAEADAKGTERLTDKTVKRHLSALSQYFQYAVDAGHLTVAARGELVADHRFRDAEGAREQRDQCTPGDLAKLFASPVWTGCHPYFRTRPGPEIIRDARFWLPILALYHGARLEELADLYRRDVGCDDGTWFIRLTESDRAEDGKRRRLKNDNAKRTVPLHPELIRLGFLDYVADTAPQPDDPLFPDLEPQGEDGKRGPRLTRWFVEYRRDVTVYREGVGMHAFRHTATTRLEDTIKDRQQERHIAFLMGHSRGGGEGRVRYDKGPGLKAVAETLALLRFPEVDLSHLYVAPEEAKQAA